MYQQPSKASVALIYYGERDKRVTGKVDRARYTGRRKMKSPFSGHLVGGGGAEGRHRTHENRFSWCVQDCFFFADVGLRGLPFRGAGVGGLAPSSFLWSASL